MKDDLDLAYNALLRVALAVVTTVGAMFAVTLTTATTVVEGGLDGVPFAFAFVVLVAAASVVVSVAALKLALNASDADDGIAEGQPTRTRLARKLKGGKMKSEQDIVYFQMFVVMLALALLFGAASVVVSVAALALLFLLMVASIGFVIYAHGVLNERTAKGRRARSRMARKLKGDDVGCQRDELVVPFVLALAVLFGVGGAVLVGVGDANGVVVGVLFMGVGSAAFMFWVDGIAEGRPTRTRLARKLKGVK